MTTVQNIWDSVLALIDSFTEDGVAISQADNIDVEKKFFQFINTEQRELWKQNRITKTIEIISKPPKNRINNGYQLLDFTGTTQYYPSEDGTTNVNGYSIQVNAEASDNATITLQERVGGAWSDLVTITPTGITEITTYKGVLTVTGDRVRIKVDGSQHFLHQNRALWEYLYKADSVPTYEPWVKYDLPSDFHQADMVVNEFPVGQYDSMRNYKLENYRDFYYNIEYEGTIRITYHPIPTTLTAFTDELEIDDILAETMVYGIVAKLGFYENPDLVNWAEGRRQESKLDAAVNDAEGADVIVNYYGG